MSDRSLIADARAAARRATGQPEPGLREQVAEALRRHYIDTRPDIADADGNLPCSCAGWREGGDSDEDSWDAHMAEVAAAVVQPLLDKATARGDIWKAKAVAIEKDRDALLNQPALRLCVYPHCLRQFDLSGQPTRPEWSSKGWLQVRAVDGYVCPDHAAAVRVHTPRWLATGTFLVCACGWESPPVRWRGYGAEAWKDHLLTEEQQ